MYRQAPHGYAYHHPLRIQSLSLGGLHPLDRTPFTAIGYGPHDPDYMRYGEIGMGRGGDNKQRKRRGNLPKKTTDKLKAWFMAHLHHPYPTEEPILSGSRSEQYLKMMWDNPLLLYPVRYVLVTYLGKPPLS